MVSHAGFLVVSHTGFQSINSTMYMTERSEGVYYYDQGMGNRGEVFMTWEGFEPGTWSLELWDLKQFKLRTL